jgi:hypothetical protein
MWKISVFSRLEGATARISPTPTFFYQLLSSKPPFGISKPMEGASQALASSACRFQFFLARILWPLDATSWNQ